MILIWIADRCLVNTLEENFSKIVKASSCGSYSVTTGSHSSSMTGSRVTNCVNGFNNSSEMASFPAPSFPRAIFSVF